MINPFRRVRSGIKTTIFMTRDGEPVVVNLQTNMDDHLLTRSLYLLFVPEVLEFTSSGPISLP